jgi:hypothetical protein
MSVERIAATYVAALVVHERILVSERARHRSLPKRKNQNYRNTMQPRAAVTGSTEGIPNRPVPHDPRPGMIDAKERKR